ncbi:MAG TPA: DUF1330 domain-containing protein [Thermoanaerobaculia bacterium]|nr:DUF1330 domain-containing protein [Thermoanaerobaculia bacterium]
MPAYVIVDIHIHDLAAYEEYKPTAHETIMQYGGRYLARGGAAEQLEGTRQPSRIVILGFPSAEQARAWWNAPEYAEAKALRHRIATTEMLLVEGLEAPAPR